MNGARPIYQSWILLPLGLGIILLAFCLLIPQQERSDTAWLNMVVVSLVFIANFAMFMVRLRGRSDFDARLARLSVLGTAISTYTVLALGCVLIGAYLGLPFNWLLVGQATAGFVFAVLYISATYTYHGVAAAGADHDEQRQGVKQLRSTLDRLNVQFHCAEGDLTEAGALWSHLLEDARYLSSCTRPEARELEENLERNLLQIGIALKNRPVDTGLLVEQLQQCTKLMALRRAQKNESGVNK